MKMPLYWKLFEFFADSTYMFSCTDAHISKSKTIETLILKFSVFDFIVLERIEFHPLYVFEFMK